MKYFIFTSPREIPVVNFIVLGNTVRKRILRDPLERKIKGRLYRKSPNALSTSIPHQGRSGPFFVSGHWSDFFI
jgi:hypothetical protein